MPGLAIRRSLGEDDTHAVWCVPPEFTVTRLSAQESLVFAASDVGDHTCIFGRSCHLCRREEGRRLLRGKNCRAPVERGSQD